MLSVSLDYKQAAGCLNSPSYVHVSKRAFCSLLFSKRDTIFSLRTWLHDILEDLVSVYSLKIDKNSIKSNAHRGGGFFSLQQTSGVIIFSSLVNPLEM